MPTEEFAGYFFIFEDDAKKTRTFGFGSDKDRILKRKAQGFQKDEAAPEAQDETSGETRPVLSHLIDRAMRLGMKQGHLIAMADFSRDMFRQAMIQVELIGPIEKTAIIVQEEKNFKLFGLTIDQALEYNKKQQQYDHLNEAVQELPSAILMSLVATFDSWLVDAVRDMFKMYPDRYADSDRSVSVKDVLCLSSISEFVDKITDEEVYLFSRGSHEEQVKFIEKNFHVPIITPWKRWGSFIEVFERRNLIAHGEKMYTKRYVDICTKAGHEGAAKIEGDAIRLSPKYLRQAADLLLEFAIVLSFELWRKHDNGTEADAFECLNRAVFELNVHKRYGNYILYLAA